MPHTTPAHPRAALFSSKTDEWPTPMDFYRRLDDEFGFVLDVCSSAGNHKAEHYYALDHADPARRDGLAQDWAADTAAHGVAAFCNPPYGAQIAEWMAKAHASARAGAVVVCLVPVRASSAWWHDLVLETGAEVRYVRGRLKFGTATTSAPFASAVVVYRPTDVAGQAGPVGTMPARSPSTPVRERTRQAAKTTRALIDAYTPRSLTRERWALAAGPVRAAVSGIPTDRRTASSLLSSLTKFLATPVWDGAAAPDLAGLLTETNILAFTEQLAATQTRGIYRSNLRRIAKAVAAGDIAGSPAVRTEGKHRYPDPFLVEGSRRPIAATDLFHTWMRLRARGMNSNPLEPVVTHWKSVGDPNVSTDGAGTVMPSTSIRALAEANDETEKATVTSNGSAARKATAAAGRSPGAEKPMSRRAARAHAKKARAAAAAAATTPSIVELTTPVPDDIRIAVESFSPRGEARTTWVENAELATRLVYGHRPPSVNSAKTTCSYVGRFLHWYATSALRAGLGHHGPIAAEELLDTRLIEHHLHESPDMTSRAKGTMRSALRRALGSLNPAAKPQALPHFPALAPYTATQCAQFVTAALWQPTDAATANLCFIVGLGLGAGLDSGDIRTLSRLSFTEAHLGGAPILLVTVLNGSRSRTVPVRRAYEHLVRRALELHQARTPDEAAPLIGRPAAGDAGRNVASAIDRAKLAEDTPLDLDPRRLRATWLVAAMSAPVPLADLMRAAGLASSRTFAELLPHCPAPDGARIDRVLADMDDVLTGATPAYAVRKRARA